MTERTKDNKLIQAIINDLTNSVSWSFFEQLHASKITTVHSPV